MPNQNDDPLVAMGLPPAPKRPEIKDLTSAATLQQVMDLAKADQERMMQGVVAALERTAEDAGKHDQNKQALITMEQTIATLEQRIAMLEDRLHSLESRPA